MTRVYTDKDLQQALQAVKGGTSQTRAADDHGIPRQTLNTRVKNPTSTSMGLAKEKCQRLPRDREKEVYDWALARACRSEPDPPTYLQIMDRVSCILEEDGDNEPLGKNWINGFIRRYPVVGVIKLKHPNHRRRDHPESKWKASEQGEVKTEYKSPINNHGTIAVPPVNPEFCRKESHSKCEAEVPDHGQLETQEGINNYSSSTLIPGSFWELSKPNQQSLKSFKEALRTRAKGLPRQIPGVRLLTRSEFRTRGASPPLTIVHTEFNSRGDKVPVTHHTDSTSSKSTFLGTVLNEMLAEQQDARSRIKNDPGHIKLEWNECENMKIYLIEQASDSKRVPRWVFWKSRDAKGRITGAWKPNVEIETEHLGQIVGQSW